MKEKIEEIKKKAEEKIADGKRWCRIHQGEIILFGPIVGGLVVEIIKTATKTRNVNEEKALKDRYIYDRSAGHYYELRRKPKNSEWIEIEERRNQGQNLGAILRDMRLLK